MALIYLDGFEEYPNAATMEKGFWANVNFAAIGTIEARDGTRSFGGGVSANQQARLNVPAWPYTTLFVGDAVWFSDSVKWPILELVNSAGDFVLVVGRTADNEIEILHSFTGGTPATVVVKAMPSGGSPLFTQAWNYVEAKLVMSATVGEVEVRINNFVLYSVTGIDTIAGNLGDIKSTQIYGSGQSGQTQWNDSFYITDDTGAEANGFLGDIRVRSLVATANGTTNDGVVVGAANAWQAVDELPVNETDYVAHPAGGDRDLFQMSDLPAITLDVLGVYGVIYAGKDDAGVRTLQQVLKLGANESLGTVQNPPANEFVFYGEPYTIKPGGGAWTKADVDAIEFGFQTG